MWCRYDAVHFLTNIHKRHPIAQRLGRGMGVCFVDPPSEWYSTPFSVIINVLFYNIGSRYTSTRLYKSFYFSPLGVTAPNILIYFVKEIATFVSFHNTINTPVPQILQICFSASGAESGMCRVINVNNMVADILATQGAAIVLHMQDKHALLFQ